MLKGILSEDIDGFGLPCVQEAERHNYKGLLSDLMDACEGHLAFMAGGAEEEGAIDPLPAALEAVKAALEPKDDKEGPKDDKEGPKDDKEGEENEGPIDEMATAKSTIKKYEALKNKKVWSKQEILGISHGMADIKLGNDSDMDEELKYILHELVSMFDEGKTVDISPEQSQQGIDWLKKTIVDPSGQIRKNKVSQKFDQTHADIIHNFKKFELVGFDELGHGYAPIYRTIATNGDYFDYSVYGMGIVSLKS